MQHAKDRTPPFFLLDGKLETLAVTSQDTEEMRELKHALRRSLGDLDEFAFDDDYEMDENDISTASESETEAAASARIKRAMSRKRKAEDELADEQGPPGTRSSASSAASSSASPAASMQFANGAIRITRTPGRQGAKNCVNLGDIIHKDQLVSACVYSFFIANDELFRHLPFSHASDAADSRPQIFIGRDPNMDLAMVAQGCHRHGLQIKEKMTKTQLETIMPTLQDMHRKMYGQNYHAFYACSSGSSHSKVLVLVYPDFLRLVITSCNMMDIDTELGDNHWYIHDLPKRPERAAGETEGFEADLLSHLEALNTPDEFLDSIRGAYDYSSVQVQLVTSVPGMHSGASAEQHGILRLRHVVQEMGLDLSKKAAQNKVQLEVCAASIGQLSAKWLASFYKCALGKKKLGVADEEHEVPPMKLFFPTVKDVEAADPDAQDAASNIGCYTRPWDKAAAEVRDIFHHYESKDPGRLFHQKLIMACRSSKAKLPPWYVYVGSANLSASAWGALELDKRGNDATDGTKLKIKNFECGVVVPGHLLDSLLEPGTKDWKEGIVPHNRDAARYSPKDRPWNDVKWVTGYSGDLF